MPCRLILYIDFYWKKDGRPYKQIQGEEEIPPESHPIGPHRGDCLRPLLASILGLSGKLWTDQLLL